MSLLFFDGLQDPILAPKPEWSSTNNWVSAQTGRDGGANGAARIGANSVAELLLTGAATCIVGTAMKWSGIGTSLTSLNFLDSTPTLQCLVWVNSSGFIEARRTSTAGTLLGTSSGHAAIAINTWFHLSVKVVFNSASAGTIVVQLNGVTVLNLTGITTSSVTGNVARVRWQTGTGINMDADDVYVCDAVDATASQGRANNDFLGDLRVQTLFPTGVGDTTGMTPNTAVANWTTVDENPATSTDYVSSAVGGTQDLYALGDLTGTVVTVFGVRESLYALKSDAGAGTIKPVIKENSVVTTDTAQGLSVSIGPVCGSFKWVRPSDSAVWTTTDVNALQAGQEVG